MTLATTETHQPAEMGSFDEHDEQVARYLGLNPNAPADRAMVAVCRHYDFDPLLKHVIVIPKGGVYVTRDGLLHVAHRSGQLDGIVVDREPELINGEWVARVSVYRKDMRHPFTFPGRYSQNGSNRQYAQEMALKSAEAHALRRAFDVTGLPTLDEQRPERDQDAAPRPSYAESIGAETPDAPAKESPLLDVRSGIAKAMYAGINEVGVPEAERVAWVGNVIGRDITSTKEMTVDEARVVLDHLAHLADADPATTEPAGAGE